MASRPQFSDYRSIDAIGNNAYEAIITDIPAAGGLDKLLTIKCHGFEIPGVEQSRLEIIMQGFKSYNAAGSSRYAGEFTIQYLEDSNYTVNKTMRAWKEFCAGTNSGTTGGNKVDYSRDIILRQYNPRGELAGEVIMIGCFPTKLPNTALTSTQSPEAVILDCTFSFDYHVLKSVQIR